MKLNEGVDFLVPFLSGVVIFPTKQLFTVKWISLFSGLDFHSSVTENILFSQLESQRPAAQTSLGLENKGFDCHAIVVRRLKHPPDSACNQAA